MKLAQHDNGVGKKTYQEDEGKKRRLQEMVRYLWVYSKQPQTNVTNDHGIYEVGDRPKRFHEGYNDCLSEKAKSYQTQRPLHMQQR